MDISSQEIEAIVKQVLAGMGGAQTSAAPAAYTAAPGGAAGDRGVFENVDDAVEAAWKAQRDWVANYKIEDRQRIIEAIRRCARAHVEEWCHKIVEETGMAAMRTRWKKHLAVINKTPGPECLTTEAKSGDAGLMLEEYAPFGVICSITPTTNPTETIINNTISMIAGGNTVVFNVHPRAKRVSADCLQALNTAIIEAGGPANLITMTREPTMENVDKMAANPKIRLMAGTGGMGMVNALLRSGKKCIGAGAGNPPVIVDETADIELAGRKIYEGASFDNNILCFAEKEVFAVNTAYDGLLHELQTVVGVSALEDLRLLNRYDVEGLDEAAFRRAVGTVFSEPQVDDTAAALPAGDCIAFGVEPLPGQFDQRADSAAQCIQLMTQEERPTVRTARIYLLFGPLTAADVDAVKRYVLKPRGVPGGVFGPAGAAGGRDRRPGRRGNGHGLHCPGPGGPGYPAGAAGSRHGPGGPVVPPGILPGHGAPGPHPDGDPGGGHLLVRPLPPHHVLHPSGPRGDQRSGGPGRL